MPSAAAKRSRARQLGLPRGSFDVRERQAALGHGHGIAAGDLRAGGGEQSGLLEQHIRQTTFTTS